MPFSLVLATRSLRLTPFTVRATLQLRADARLDILRHIPEALPPTTRHRLDRAHVLQHLCESAGGIVTEGALGIGRLAVGCPQAACQPDNGDNRAARHPVSLQRLSEG